MSRSISAERTSGKLEERDRRFLSSVIILAYWRARRTWFLLFMAAMGIIAAVTIACIVPLFFDVFTTASLRGALRATPTRGEVTLKATMQGVSTPIVSLMQDRFDPFFQRDLGPYLSHPTRFSLQTTGLSIVAPSALKRANDLTFYGAVINQVAPHITLVQGRLPQSVPGEVEVMLTPDAASNLHVGVGSVLTLLGDFFTNRQEMFGGTHPSGTLKVRVVGLFTVPPSEAAYWHGEDFLPHKNGTDVFDTLLGPADAFLAGLDALAAAAHIDAVFSPVSYHLYWYYSLDPARLVFSQLDSLVGNLGRVQADIANKYGNGQSNTLPDGTMASPYYSQIEVYNPVPASYDILTILQQYRNRVAVITIPIAILALQIICLLIFFVSLIVNLLVDRQISITAILRSRGASSSQVFWSLLMQGVGLCLIALVVGPPLALFLVSIIGQHTLDPGLRDAVNLITENPWQVLLGAGWYALGTALVAIITMALLLRRAATLDVLALRRESSRASLRALWQRLNFDIMAVVIALTGYGVSLYLASIAQYLDIQTQALLLTPLALIAPVFLLIAGLLLFLRFFPFILRLVAGLTHRNRGATTMLALVQMARAPRQSIRMTMLLALAVAFAVFALVFNASQAQRASDIAAYESGADFSGNLSTQAAQPIANYVITPGNLNEKNVAQHLNQVMAKYTHISGVLSTTGGFVGTGSSSGNAAPTLPMQIRAIDATTFAQSANWTAEDSSQSLSSLMMLLNAQRGAGVANGVVPAIVDVSTLNKLNLHMNATFTLQVDGLPVTELNCVVVAVIQHIPTINDSALPGTSSSYTSPGGVLVDYNTYALVYDQQAFQAGYTTLHLPLNYIWLRTREDAAALATVRGALTSPALYLNNLYDRRALTAELLTDPLYLNLVIMLTIGAITAFLLALVGDLLASWLSVRTRLANFAVLRALGATPGQVVRLLSWEQGIMYITALLLGAVFGALLCATAVPSLVFTSVPSQGALSGISDGEFFVIQHVIPTRIVVPLSLDVIFVVLIAICICALGTMARTVLRPAMNQELRLNED